MELHEEDLVGVHLRLEVGQFSLLGVTGRDLLVGGQFGGNRRLVGLDPGVDLRLVGLVVDQHVVGDQPSLVDKRDLKRAEGVDGRRAPRICERGLVVHG